MRKKIVTVSWFKTLPVKIICLRKGRAIGLKKCRVENKTVRPGTDICTGILARDCGGTIFIFWTQVNSNVQYQDSFYHDDRWIFDQFYKAFKQVHLFGFLIVIYTLY